MRNYLYMVLAAICLGTIGVLVKLIGTEVHFMTLSFYRFFFGFLFLLVTVPFIDKKAFKVSSKDLKEYFMMGLVLAASITLYTTSVVFAPIHNVVLIASIYPFFVLILAYFYLKEKITSTKIITLVIAITGLAIMNPFNIGSYALGNTLSLASAFVYAIAVTGMRKIDKTHGIGDVMWFMLFGTLLLSPFVFVYGLGNFTNVAIYVLLLGFVSTGLAYLLFNLALEKIEAEVGSIITTIITPLVSIFLAVLIINEVLSTNIILGGLLLIIAGIYLETHDGVFKRSLWH